MLLAQVNVARMRAAPDSPVMAGFMAVVDPVYRMAKASPGFVWRMRGAGGHMPTCRDEVAGWQIVNVSVWVSYEALHRFVYRSHHGGLVRRSAEWSCRHRNRARRCGGCPTTIGPRSTRPRHASRSYAARVPRLGRDGRWWPRRRATRREMPVGRSRWRRA